MKWRFIASVASSAMWGTGCGADGGASADPSMQQETTESVRSPGLLVDNALWQPVGAEDDPFPSHRPDAFVCQSDGAHLEGSALEIETDLCTYFSGVQPSLVDVMPGDQLRIYAFHAALAATEPAQAHIAVLIDDHILWEEHVPIPKDATPYDIVGSAAFAALAGTPVHFHLHNHGYNTWKLLEIEVIPAS